MSRSRSPAFRRGEWADAHAEYTGIESPWGDAHCPRDESTLRNCPVEACDHAYHEPDLLAVHLADAHPVDRKWRDEALVERERYPPVRCPVADCGVERHTHAAVRAHVEYDHGAGERGRWRAVVPTEPVEALDKYGRVLVAPNKTSGEVVHLHEGCPNLIRIQKTPEHPGELPLAASRICKYCAEWCTDDAGELVEDGEVGT